MRRRFHYAAAQAGFRIFHHLAFGYRVEGIENVPLEGPCLLAANHKSYLDPLAAGAPLRREIHYFAKRELFSVPILGPMIRAVGGIPVDRHSFDRQAIHRALEVLRAGHGMLLFPEGTRIRRPSLASPKEGVAMLALQADVPVIPVWIGHTWEPRRSLFRRIPVLVRYGTPIHFSAPSSGRERRALYSAVSLEVMEAIARTAPDPIPIEPSADPPGRIAAGDE
jgi:1-acyl-sn-glycerol-3-phosphate acyltransferase